MPGIELPPPLIQPKRHIKHEADALESRHSMSSDIHPISKRDDLSVCQLKVTPACIRFLYNMTMGSETR